MDRDNIREEKAGLDDRLARLFKFLRTEEFDDLDDTSKMLLRAQYYTMDAYSHILSLRLSIDE